MESSDVPGLVDVLSCAEQLRTTVASMKNETRYALIASRTAFVVLNHHFRSATPVDYSLVSTVLPWASSSAGEQSHVMQAQVENIERVVLRTLRELRTYYNASLPVMHLPPEILSTIFGMVQGPLLDPERGACGCRLNPSE